MEQPAIIQKSYQHQRQWILEPLGATLFLLLIPSCYQSTASLECNELEFDKSCVEEPRDTTSTDDTDSHPPDDDSEPPYQSIFPMDWQLPKYIKATNSYTDFHFGQSVDINENKLVVGAEGEDNPPPDDTTSSWFPNAGAAYVYTRENSLWHAEARLKAANTEAEDFFGWSVAIEGNVVVVGAPEEDSAATAINGDDQNNDAPGAGAAYVFQRAGNDWVQQAYLKASNGNAGDRFGWSVAIEDGIIAISAIGEAASTSGINPATDNNAPESGAVYIFESLGDSWQQTAYLKASNADAYDYFGYAVAMDDHRLAVGAHGEAGSARGANGDQTDNTQPGTGAVYIFDKLNGIWHQSVYLKASNSDADDGFGSALDFSNGTLVVGAQQEDSNAVGTTGNGFDNSLTYAGAAYVFKRINSQWAQTAYLKASNTDPYDLFGCDVAIFEHILVVGAYGESSATIQIDGLASDNGAERAGAVYLFENVDGAWQQQAYIKAFNGDGDDRFGVSVAIENDIFAVGATGEDAPGQGIVTNPSEYATHAASGAVYVYSLEAP